MLNWRGTKRVGFTLIEVLISIAIIAVLSALLVPSIDRSLSRNNLANDVDLLRSKIEETRLLAGSTQQADSKTTGYYALFLPGGTNTYFSILRIDDTTNTCPLGAAVGQANSGGDCVVERVSLSKNVSLQNGQGNSGKLVLFRSPTQQLSESHHKGYCNASGCYTPVDGPPLFSSWGTDVKLQFKTKAATVILEDYTGKLKVTYN